MDHRIRARLLERLNRDAAFIARRFGLRFRVIEAERAGVKRRYGACYDDGTIKIRLVHAVTGAPLRYSSLVSTLCHELAHLRYWNHDARFEAYYRRLLAFARREGIYRPRARTGPAAAVATGATVKGATANAPAAKAVAAATAGRPHRRRAASASVGAGAALQGRAGVQQQYGPGAKPRGVRGKGDAAADKTPGRPRQLRLFG